MLSERKSSTVTLDAPPVVASPVTLEAGHRIDSPVDPVPGEIIPPVGHFAPRLILVFVARFEFLLVGVTVGTERLHVTGQAEGLVPRRLKAMGSGKINGVIIG